MRGRMAQINDLPLKMALGGDTFCAPREGVERGGGTNQFFMERKCYFFKEVGGAHVWLYVK